MVISANDITVMQPLKPGKDNTLATSCYNDLQNLRDIYIVSYHDNNVILMYCPALFATICFVLVSVHSMWSLWHWAKDIGY